MYDATIVQSIRTDVMEESVKYYLHKKSFRFRPSLTPAYGSVLVLSIEK